MRVKDHGHAGNKCSIVRYCLKMEVMHRSSGFVVGFFMERVFLFVLRKTEKGVYE